MVVSWLPSAKSKAGRYMIPCLHGIMPAPGIGPIVPFCPLRDTRVILHGNSETASPVETITPAETDVNPLGDDPDVIRFDGSAPYDHGFG
jgi:hypothetical protein